MRLFSSWRRSVVKRFSDRPDIGKKEVYLQYFEPMGLSEKCVLECLDLIETEYDVSAGLIRPNDNISLLVGDVMTKNPIRWVFYRAREEDIQSELNYQLGKRMRQHGTEGLWKDIDTIGDFVRAWCGGKPVTS
jgi:hypothetical protein